LEPVGDLINPGSPEESLFDRKSNDELDWGVKTNDPDSGRREH